MILKEMLLEMLVFKVYMQWQFRTGVTFEWLLNMENVAWYLKYSDSSEQVLFFMENIVWDSDNLQLLLFASR